jgi:hypothetical protein
MPVGPRSMGARANDFARAILVSPLLPLYLAAVVVALGLPSLERHWGGDDYMQRVWLLGKARFPQLDPAYFRAWPAVDMHVSVEGDPRSRARLMDLGELPWWTAPDLRIAPLRLLASATHWLDYRLWPESGVLMHVHSLLWAALCVGAAALLYRRMLGPTSPALAGLAVCLFAFDSAHAAPSYALSYRNGLVALFFGILAVLAHVRLREEGGKAMLVLAPVLFATALLSAEVGVATFSYVLAHAVFLDRGPRADRVRALLPYVSTAFLWQVLYAKAGYGVAGSSAYINPPAEPARFLAAVVERVPFYLLGQWIDLDVAMLLLGTGRKLWVVGIVSTLAVAAALLPILRRDAPARFWASGMVLCLIPICAVVPFARRLLFAGVGAAGLLAYLLAFSLRPKAPMPAARRAYLVLVAVALVSSRLVLGPVLLWVEALPSLAGYEMLEIPLDYSVEKQTLVILNPPTALVMLAIPFAQAVEGRAVPHRLRCLAATRASGTVTRTDDRTLSIQVKGGYLTELDDTIFRDPSRSPKTDDRIQLEGLAVEVLSSKEDGRPWNVLFRFDVPLEDPSLRWMQWAGRGYVPFQPPAVGSAVEFTPRGAGPAGR